MRKFIAAGVVAMGAMASQADAQQLRFMTGPQGGAWYPLGGSIQNMLANDGIRIQVLPGGGVANAQGIQGGQADIAFGNSISVVDAIEGREPFTGQADNICLAASLYPQYFQIVATQSSGIQSVEDLQGRRIATQPVGNTAEQVTRSVLQTAGLSYDDMRGVDFVSYTDAVGLLQNGNAEVFTLGTTIPAASVMDLANSTRITLVPLSEEFIEQMRDEINPGYAAYTVPAGTYPGQDEDVTVVGYATQLIVRCDLDEAVVGTMLERMWENRAELASIAAVMRDLSLEGMQQEGGVPLHAAARTFYEAHTGQ
ncbi:MAG: TAXI family TRAP transporter solute-binding subunit [Alkalilacustris sp.]